MQRSTFLVIILRTDEPVPDPVVALWKDGLVERVDLGPLSRDEVEQLAAAVLGGPVVGTAVRDIYRASSGNAMLARELVVGAIEAGRFTNEGGLWHLRGRLPLSTRLADMVETLGARRREDALRVGTWRLEGGGRSQPSLLLAAARTSCMSRDLGLAERLARAGSMPEEAPTSSSCSAKWSSRWAGPRRPRRSSRPSTCRIAPTSSRPTWSWPAPRTGPRPRSSDSASGSTS